MPKDLYETLGVSKTATTEEIKRAYRKLAHQCHPDKAGKEGEARFKEINEAYQILSDEQKRAQYDQFGSTGSNAGGFGGGGYSNAGGGFEGFDFGGGGFGNLGDIFETVFGQAFAQVQTEININLTSSLLGEKIELQTSNGERIVLDLPAGTQDGTTFRFRGKGQTFKRGRGDLLVTVRIKMPRKMNREQRELLEKLRDAGL